MNTKVLNWIALGLGVLALAVAVGLLISSNAATRASRGYVPGSRDVGNCYLDDGSIIEGIRFRQCDNATGNPQWIRFCLASDSEIVSAEPNSSSCYENPDLGQGSFSETVQNEAGFEEECVTSAGGPCTSQEDFQEFCTQTGGGENCATIDFDVTAIDEGWCILADEDNTQIRDSESNCTGRTEPEWYLWCPEPLEPFADDCFINPNFVQSIPPGEETTPFVGDCWFSGDQLLRNIDLSTCQDSDGEEWCFAGDPRGSANCVQFESSSSKPGTGGGGEGNER
jgi:hypothetical protein